MSSIPESEEAPYPQSGHLEHTGTILLIDDDTDFQQYVSRLLAKAGYNPVIAADGASGVALAAQKCPDLILCDLEMPGMHGHQVLSQLRADTKLSGIPVIFLTGRSEQHEVREGMNLGADDYLTKPVASLDLLRTIAARLLRKRAEQQRLELQTDKAMKIFAEVVHDLRDPLFAVLVCEGMLEDLKGSSNENETRSKKILTRLQAAVSRMEQILSQTMLMAKTRLQQAPFKPETFDLRVFCHALVTGHINSKRITLVCSEEGELPIYVDSARLRQALENLLSNALKYSEGPVRMEVLRCGQTIIIRVADKGIGISEQDQRALFQPFFRGSNVGRIQGNGLGLCIVKSCIEGQGGKIRCYSQPGAGTTFELVLPEFSGLNDRPPDDLDAGAELSKEHALQFSEPPLHSLKALVVDDDPLCRDSLIDLLHASGQVQVLAEARDVAHARSALRRLQVDVVFLDINLPDGSGLDLLPDVKDGTSVVFVTSTEEHAVHAFECEATDYLLKPFNKERLMQALKRVVSRHSPASPSLPPPEQADGCFSIKTLTEQRVVKFSGIRQILAYGEYSWIFWDNQQKGALLRKSLKQWQLELPGERFLRVHRRAIINLEFLDKIQHLPNGRLEVHLRDTPKPILVSLRLAPMLRRKLKELQARPQV